MSMKMVRNAMVTTPTMNETTPRAIARLALVTPRMPPGALVLDRVLHLVDDLVVVLQEPQRAPSGGQVLDEPRHGVGELLDLADERRDQERTECGEREQREQEDDQGRDSAPEPAALEELDGGVEREREEERDQDPGDDVPCEEEERDDRRGGEDDPEDDEDRPGTERDEAFLGVPLLHRG